MDPAHRRGRPVERDVLQPDDARIERGGRLDRSQNAGRFGREGRGGVWRIGRAGEEARTCAGQGEEDGLKRAGFPMAHADPTTKTLAELGVTDAAGVARLFADLRGGFAAQIGSATNAGHWEELRSAWGGRKSGALTRVTENWLKPVSPELKRAVGQELNALKAHVEQALEAARAQIDASATQSAA